MNKATKTMMLTFTLAAAWALQSFAAVASLPSGYTRLEWIAGTGTQYIATDYTPDCTDKITVRFRMPTYASSIQTLYCARKNGKDTMTCLIFESGTIRFDHNGGTIGRSPAKGRDADYILTADGNIAAGNTTTNSFDAYTMNGVVQELSEAVNDRTGSFTVGSPLYLFRAETDLYYGRFRMYYFQVRDTSDNLKLDLRPCRNPEGEIGMYDLVNEKFYGNSGTGEFDTNETSLPPGYFARTWIGSSGTQWINTSFTPLCFDTVSVNFKFRALSSGNHAVFCARTGGTRTFSFLKVGAKFRFDHNAKNYTVSSSISPVVNTDYTVAMNGTTRNCYVNGVYDKTCSDEGVFTVGSPFILFAAVDGTYNASNTAVTMLSSYRLYSFVVTDSATGTILCDLQPCVRNSDDKPGLYDRINKRFLTNGGTGEFTVSGGAILIVF